MEYEIRFYYPSESYEEKLALLNAIKELNYEGKSHEITSQFVIHVRSLVFILKQLMVAFE